MLLWCGWMVLFYITSYSLLPRGTTGGSAGPYSKSSGFRYRTGLDATFEELSGDGILYIP